MMRLAAILTLIFALQANAATIVADSAEYPNVTNAIAQASTGDIVQVPAGTAYWTNRLIITDKGITLQGAGTNDTIIVDELGGSRYSLISVSWTNLGGLFRLTGFQFRAGTTNTSAMQAGLITLNASNLASNNSAWRVDSCMFLQGNSRALYIGAWSGLIDHCIFSNNNGGLFFDSRNMTGGGYGDTSWATPVYAGTTNAGVYMESCWVTNTAQRAVSDTAGGSRFVYRYNTFYNVSVQTHGTETTTRARGHRYAEVYGNNMTNTASQVEGAVHLRSGTALVFSNNIFGTYPSAVRGASYRMYGGTFSPWGKATGTNAFDYNDPGSPFGNGTHDGTNSSTILSVSGATWTPDEWIGYAVENENSTLFGLVTDNDATTMTFAAPIFSSSRVYWTNGNTYVIRKVVHPLDGVGMGSGDLLSGGGDSTPPTPQAWPNQATNAVRLWANVGVTNFSSTSADIRANEKYLYEAPEGYVPLEYPHPLAGGSAPAANPRNINAVNFRPNNVFIP